MDDGLFLDANGKLEGDLREYIYIQAPKLGLIFKFFESIQKDKDKNYASGWSRRGLRGYKLGCILRQVDRLEPLFLKYEEELMKGDVNEDTINELLDTLMDISIYAAMGWQLFAVLEPNVFSELDADIRFASESIEGSEDE